MPTNQYHANHATFELPAGLKDKTMHMFTLKDDGPSEFSVVISHADCQPEEEIDDFGGRLIKELERALPKFQLRGMRERKIDASPAIELVYSWRNDGIFMHQRQAITLVEGPTVGSKQAMLIAATCLQAFSDQWNAAFDQLLDSVKLRRPLSSTRAEPEEDEVEVNRDQPWIQAVGGPPLPTVFAFNERRRTLHVFAQQDQACRRTDAREVEHDAWAFFDGDGRALKAVFMIPNESALRGKAGTYVLEAAPKLPGLLNSLRHAAVLHCSEASVQFDSIAQVRLHLKRRAAGPGVEGIFGQQKEAS
ncbi:MAG: DcrB-related protein [Telluria sp.]